MYQPDFTKFFHVGAAVMTLVPCMQDPAGTKALVYEVYQIDGRQGVSLISQTGADWGGWSDKDLAKAAAYLGQTTWARQISALSELARAKQLGEFSQAFLELEALWLPRGAAGYLVQQNRRAQQRAGDPKDDLDLPRGGFAFVPRHRRRNF